MRGFMLSCTGADPENIEPRGVTVLIIRLSRGAQIYFFRLIYKGKQGACDGCDPSKSAPDVDP